MEQHEQDEILRSLAAVLTAQHEMHWQQMAINEGVQRTLVRVEITLARIETLLARMLRPEANGREAS